MDGCTVIEAHIKINRYGINPGGEIMFFDVTEAAHKINAADKNRLLTKEEAERIGDEDESVCQNS